MIRDEKVTETTIKGKESKAIGLSASDKIFTIIFSSLYKNIAESIVRELWTNAYDSHREAGVADKPFSCRLPTQLDPTFTVRDYGTSMDHDKVMNHYSVAGSSDREDSNDYVGALGIGSKSPLSYTDSFTVKAFSGTEVRVYVVHLDEDNCPHISHTATFESDEPRGIEISFAAASHDGGDFSRAAHKVAYGFDTKPIVPGEEFATPEPIFEADNVRIYRDQDVPYLALGDGRYRTSYYIKMGTVLYPYVPDNNYRMGRTGFFQQNLTVVIDAPIGAVNFVPSREELRMTDKTKSFVTGAISAIEEGFFEIVASEVKEAKNNSQRHKAFTRWMPMLTEGTLSKFIKDLGLDEVINLHHVLVKHLPENMKKLTNKNFEAADFGKDNSMAFRWASLPQTYFVIDNNPKRTIRAHSRVVKFAGEVGITPGTYYNGSIYYLKNPSNKEVERLIRLLCLERSQVININSLADPGPSSASGQPNPDGLRGAWYPTDATYDWGFTDKVSEMPKNYYWIHLDPLERRAAIPFEHLTVPHGTFHFRQNYESTLLRLAQHIIALNGDDPTTRVYVLGRQALAKLEPDESREFSLVAKNALEKRKADFYKLINYSPVSSVYRHRAVEELLCSDTKPNVDPVVAEVFRAAHVSKIVDILRLTFTDTPEARQTDVTIENKYPLLFNHLPTKEQIQEYIDFINAKGASK